MAGFGKFFMKHLWRFQQIGGLVTVILMCLNLTIPIYTYTHWRFERLGIPSRWDWLIILIIFSIVFLIALIAGYAYDKVFKLWSPQKVVGIERDPYAKGRLTPAEYWRYQYAFIPILLKSGLRAEAEFNLKWNERCLERDPDFRKDVNKIRKYVEKYKLKSVDKRWLQDISKLIKERQKAKLGRKAKIEW